MLKLQIGQILTMSKSDLSWVWECFQATYIYAKSCKLCSYNDWKNAWDRHQSQTHFFYKHHPWSGVLRLCIILQYISFKTQTFSGIPDTLIEIMICMYCNYWQGNSNINYFYLARPCRVQNIISRYVKSGDMLSRVQKYAKRDDCEQHSRFDLVYLLTGIKCATPSTHPSTSFSGIPFTWL